MSTPASPPRAAPPPDGPAPGGGRRLALLAGLVVLALGLANGLAGRVLPDVPGSDAAARNPYRFRGYPEYLDGLSPKTGGRDLVLLSNSQAYAGELPASHIYPVRLQRLLNRPVPPSGPRWRVHNWSVDGITSMEYMLMAAALRDRAPDLVVASVGYADFKGRNAGEDFRHCRSDLPRLVGRWTVARRLPGPFWRRHGRVEQVLAAGFREHLPLLRLPEYLWSAVDQVYPGAQPLFYAPAVYHHPWALPLEPRRPNVRLARPPPAETGLDYYAYDDRSTLLLDEFLAALAAVPAPRRLLVACPGNQQPGSRHEASVRRFREEAARLAARHGIPFLDLGDALPPEDFIDSLHFNARNHLRYAEHLWRAVTTEPEPADRAVQ